MIPASEILRRILLGGDIEDKLVGGFSLDELDWSVSSNLILPDVPGRSGALAISSTEEQKERKTRFPKKSELKNHSARGRLLHFFANHELLAIETMAYTLLKFPEAPLEFKRGVMKTLQDEQRHMRLYLDRMQDYGVELGEVPLNLYFWNTLKTMASPLDFVARMSLTFEQANLDFALEYARLFEEEIADEKTASLLRLVHDDEVKHVAHGLKWFNLWRSADSQGEVVPFTSEWDSFKKLLPFPITARRAKGAHFFSEESRKAAGFSDDYIQRLRVAGGSRGRVPDYFFFNPQCELESNFQELPRALKTKIEDLAPLLVWLAQEDDVVEVPTAPPLSWLKEVFEAKGQLPEIVRRPEEVVSYIAFEEFKPWGWGKSAFLRFSNLESRVRHAPAVPFHAEFFSKAEWKNKLGTPGWVISSEKDFDDWVITVETGKFIFKAGLSTSGRGHFVVTAEDLKDPDKIQQIKKRLKWPSQYVVEPFYDKVIDFSFQYEILRDGTVKSWEPRFFEIDSQFQYRGAYIGTWRNEFEAESALLRQEMKKIQEEHARVIALLQEKKYVGPLGIDGLIYRTAEGLAVNSIVEVNVRYTMGRVAQELERTLKGKYQQGFWAFLSKSEIERAGFKDFAEVKIFLENKFGVGKVIATTPITASQTWTVFVAGSTKFVELIMR